MVVIAALAIDGASGVKIEGSTDEELPSLGNERVAANIGQSISYITPPKAWPRSSLQISMVALVGGRPRDLLQRSQIPQSHS